MRAMPLVLVVAAWLVAAAGCQHDPELLVTDIAVTGETDFGNLDVEVHLFDAVTHAHLGCAGAGEGLEKVDADDIHYEVSAFFRDPITRHQVPPAAVDGRPIEVQVIEDDLDPCPTAPGPDDDVIGISPALDVATFDRGETLAFDRVVTLRVSIE